MIFPSLYHHLWSSSVNVKHPSSFFSLIYFFIYIRTYSIVPVSVFRKIERDLIPLLQLLLFTVVTVTFEHPWRIYVCIQYFRFQHRHRLSPDQSVFRNGKYMCCKIYELEPSRRRGFRLVPWEYNWGACLTERKEIHVSYVKQSWISMLPAWKYACFNVVTIY